MLLANLTNIDFLAKDFAWKPVKNWTIFYIAVNEVFKKCIVEDLPIITGKDIIKDLDPDPKILFLDPDPDPKMTVSLIKERLKLSKKTSEKCCIIKGPSKNH